MLLPVLVLHGPNLHRLGTREPELYGTTTLADVDAALRDEAARLGLALTTRQSNHEGVLLDALYDAVDAGCRGVLLNAGAFAHTSLALADAIRAVRPVPVVEVHITNTSARDTQRHASPVGAACAARVEGFGVASYRVALLGLAGLLGTKPPA